VGLQSSGRHFRPRSPGKPSRGHGALASIEDDFAELLISKGLPTLRALAARQVLQERQVRDTLGKEESKALADSSGSTASSSCA